MNPPIRLPGARPEDFAADVQEFLAHASEAERFDGYAALLAQRDSSLGYVTKDPSATNVRLLLEVVEAVDEYRRAVGARS